MNTQVKHTPGIKYICDSAYKYGCDAEYGLELCPLHVAASELLEACHMALASLKEADERGVFQALVSMSALERAIAMAEGRT
jgi:hypothetical protein